MTDELTINIRLKRVWLFYVLVFLRQDKLAKKFCMEVVP